MAVMRNRTMWLALAVLCCGMLLAEVARPARSEPSVAHLRATITTTPAPPTTVPSATVPPTSTIPAPTIAPTILAADVNDTPHLTDNVAPTAQPIVAPAAADPIRLQIPAIGLDYRPVSVGLDQNSIPVVPKHDVGWYNLGASPGEDDNVVFWGHVLRFKAQPDVPAPFARVKELQRGAEVIVTTADDRVTRYRVTKAVQVTPDQVEYILPTGTEQITLVSCIGDKVVEDGYVTKKYRLVTIAEPVP